MAPSKRTGVGHVLIIASLTSGIHWTVIKDDLRSLCPRKSRGPGRVDVDKYSCTVKMDSKEDAEHVFDQLVARGLPRLPGLSLLVHYTQTFENGRTKTINCNGTDTVCRNGNHVAGTEDHFANVQAWYAQYYGWASTQATPAYAVPSAYSAPVASSFPAAMEASTTYVWDPETLRSVYATLQAYQYPSIATTNYRISPTTNLPVNTSGGMVQTESRGIFIRNLSYKTTDSELKKLLKQFGKPLKCELHKDKENKPTGSATALFASTEEAKIVEGRLDGHRHRGHKLSVRSDRETTSLVEESAGPSLLIANGSTA